MNTGLTWRPSRLQEIARSNPALIATLAYASLSLAGAAALMLPLMRDASRIEPVLFVDALFISTSAVSTTGLSTLDSASTFSFAGEAVLLLLLQIGGVGYMTFMSFAYLLMRNSLGRTQTDLARAGFGLNNEYSIPRFLRAVVISTLLIEVVGAAVLSRAFAVAGVDNPVWQGVFHSVSAFCTAGFSLFPNSLENFKGDPLVLYSVSVLSYLGAIGFVVIAELVDSLVRQRAQISPTSKIILKVTAGLAIFATGMLWAFEPSIHALPVELRLDNAFFQAMTASTTVGFNSVPIGSLAPTSLMIIYLLMFIGASPSGTGGGLKSSTAAVLWATAVASIAGRDKVISSGVVIPPVRVHQAAATFVLAMCTIFAGVVGLDLTGSYSFDKALFEVISALSTVGLSMGLTGELNAAGKLVITLVMFIGRVGILAFFLAVARRQGGFDNHRLRERDVIL